jgi:hypothetical protein
MQGTQTHLDFIPERTTDFIFAAFAEEFGLLGNACLLGALYVPDRCGAWTLPWRRPPFSPACWPAA